ncbi:hypothetical protein B0H10DRAFT_1971548 [Mycena sp. CBHHK59/15]|nr:hypothetical protein B0H10DRAFT_1971548 [Mycena sp. CBHHK59/15]
MRTTAAGGARKRPRQAALSTSRKVLFSGGYYRGLMGSLRTRVIPVELIKAYESMPLQRTRLEAERLQHWLECESRTKRMSHERWDVAQEPQVVQVDRQWVLPTTEQGCLPYSIQHAAVQVPLAYSYRGYHTIQAASQKAAGTSTQNYGRILLQFDVPLGSLNRISDLVIMTVTAIVSL